MHKIELKRGTLGRVINELLVYELCPTERCVGTRWFYPYNGFLTHVCDRCHSPLFGKDLLKRQQARVDYHVG